MEMGVTSGATLSASSINKLYNGKRIAGIIVLRQVLRA